MKLYALLFCSFPLLLIGQSAIDTTYYENELKRLRETDKTSLEKIIKDYQVLKTKAVTDGYFKGALMAQLGVVDAHYRLQDYEKARYLADSVVQVAADLNLKEVRAHALYEKAWCSRKMDLLYAATTELLLAERIYLELNDKKRLGNVYYTLAHIYRDLEDLEGAEKHTLKAIKVAKELNDEFNYLKNYYNYASILMERRECEKALPILDKITDGLKKIDDAQALHLLNHVQDGRLECGPYTPSILRAVYQSLVHIEKKKEHLLAYGDISLGLLYANLSEYYLITRRPKKALEYIEKRMPIINTIGKFGERRVLLQQSKYFNLIGKNDSALIYYKQYEQRKTAMLRNKERTKIHQLNLRFEREKKDNEIASQNLKLQLLEQRAKKQRLYLLFFFGTAFVLGLGVFVIYLKRKNSLLKRAQAEAMQGIRTKSLFLDTITHELRTPLSTILGSAHLLEGEKNEESRNGLIKAIRFSSEYLNKLIENTILLKTLGTPKPLQKVEKRPLERFNCRELLEGLRGTIAQSKNNNRLEIRIDKNIPNFLIGPELDLSRILFNLLGNSDKFTQNGFIKITVQKSIAIPRDRIALNFTISDNGSGIKDDEKEKVFDAFYSGRAHRSEQYAGMGLGLNLVKGLLKKHGTEPRLESRFGIGTSISFTMEFGVPKEQKAPFSTPIPQNQKAKQSILLVEDNEVNQDMIKKIIVGLGYHCDVADNGKIAVEKYKALRYSLVLMDMMMPVMDGFEATLLIKEFDPKAIIVALTAVSKEKYDDIFKELKMAAVISKPASAKTIRRVLEQQLHPDHEVISVS